MYVAVIENGAFIIVYENGTALDLQGQKYKLISHIDENSETVIDCWQLSE